MTPDESFRLRARNANEKRSDIILSRSNSDFSNNKNFPNQSNLHMSQDNQKGLLNSTNFGNTHNPNYTNYNMYRDSSSNNFLQRKNSSQNVKEANNSKTINANSGNNKIYRSPIDPRKTTKISPIRPSFNVNEKSSSPSKERDIYKSSYNSGSNAFSGSYGYDNSKNKYYNNGNQNNNLNGNNSNNSFLVITSAVSKSTHLDSNGLNDWNIGNKSYLPNVNNKNGNGNGKEKGLYNGNQQYIYSEKK